MLMDYIYTHMKESESEKKYRRIETCRGQGESNQGGVFVWLINDRRVGDQIE